MANIFSCILRGSRITGGTKCRKIWLQSVRIFCVGKGSNEWEVVLYWPLWPLHWPPLADLDILGTSALLPSTCTHKRLPAGDSIKVETCSEELTLTLVTKSEWRIIVRMKNLWSVTGRPAATLADPRYKCIRWFWQGKNWISKFESRLISSWNASAGSRWRYIVSSVNCVRILVVIPHHTWTQGY